MPAPDRRSGGKDSASWITCAWPLADTLLSGGAGGELISWHLDKPAKRGGSEYRVISRSHLILLIRYHLIVRMMATYWIFDN